MFPAICLLSFGSKFGPVEKWACGTLFFRKITLVWCIDRWGEAVSWAREAKHTVDSKCLFKFELSHIFIWGLPSKKIIHRNAFFYTYSNPKAVIHYEEKVTNQECNQRRKTYCVKEATLSSKSSTTVSVVMDNSCLVHDVFQVLPQVMQNIPQYLPSSFAQICPT